jgi:hypothetical protein
MKTLISIILLALQITLFASAPIGSWEIDSEASLKNDPTFNERERYLILGLADELNLLKINKDNTLMLGADKGTWKKVLTNSYLFNFNGRGVNAILKDDTHLNLQFDIRGEILTLNYVPKGSIVKAKRVLPKDFPYYEKAYRSELTMGDGKYKFLKLSKEGILYEYYGSSERTIDPALITNKIIEFSGNLPTLQLNREAGDIVFDKNNVYLELKLKMRGNENYILADYKDPSIIPNSTMPWTKESIKAYTLKNPTHTYHQTGFDLFESKTIDKEVEFSIKDHPEKFMDDPAGSVYTLTSPQTDGSIHYWSQFSPFVPNYVPKKNAHKIKYTIDGDQEITTPAGTFLCTILNLDADGEVIKAWMIKDRPGVYAKYISLMGTYTLIK